MKATTLAIALLVLTAGSVMMPSASASSPCPSPTTFDKVQQCVENVGDAAQGIVIGALERACDFFGC